MVFRNMVCKDTERTTKTHKDFQRRRKKTHKDTQRHSNTEAAPNKCSPRSFIAFPSVQLTLITCPVGCRLKVFCRHGAIPKRLALGLGARPTVEKCGIHTLEVS